MFTIITMVISNIFIFLIFGISEQFIKIVNERFTFLIMLQVAETTLVMALAAASIGIKAVGIGFIKKSVPTTIVSAVLIASLMCNIVVNATSSKAILYLFAIVMMSIGILVSILLMKKVNNMEVQ